MRNIGVICCIASTDCQHLDVAAQGANKDLLINILLTILGYIPGCVVTFIPSHPAGWPNGWLPDWPVLQESHHTAAPLTKREVDVCFAPETQDHPRHLHHCVDTEGRSRYLTALAKSLKLYNGQFFAPRPCTLSQTGVSRFPLLSFMSCRDRLAAWC